VRRLIRDVTLSALAAVGALSLGGCVERIPDSVMNSPPAKRPDAQGSPKQEAPRQTPPRDRVAAGAATEADAAIRLTSYRAAQSSLAEVAARSLAQMGSASVSQLVEQLVAADARQRVFAAEVLARIGPDAVAATEPLVERLEDDGEQEEVRLACAKALGQIGPALWPVEPQPYLPAPELEPLPSLSDDELADPTIAAIHQRQVARRIDYDQRNERRQQQHDADLAEYRRRTALAQRVVDALSKLASP